MKILPWQSVKIFRQRHNIIAETLVQSTSHNCCLQDASSFSDEVTVVMINHEAKKCHACPVRVEKYIWVRAAININLI